MSRLMTELSCPFPVENHSDDPSRNSSNADCEFDPGVYSTAQFVYWFIA